MGGTRPGQWSRTQDPGKKYGRVLIRIFPWVCAGDCIPIFIVNKSFVSPAVHQIFFFDEKRAGWEVNLKQESNNGNGCYEHYHIETQHVPDIVRWLTRFTVKVGKVGLARELLSEVLHHGLKIKGSHHQPAPP
jgi:hypothetical protein